MNLSAYKHHQDFFAKKAATWSLSESHAEFIGRLDKLIGFNPTDVILDIGCGTGNLFPYLQDRIPAGRLIGIDFAYNMLHQCRDKLRGRNIALQSMAEILPIRSASVDVVINYCLYPHLKFKHAAIREFNRVLKQGGRYYILHPQGRAEINSLHRDIGEPVCCDVIEPVKSVIELLQANGFSVLKAIDCCDMFLVEAVKSGHLS